MGRDAKAEDDGERRLVESYPALLAFATFLTRNRFDAEDLVQQALVRYLSRRQAAPVLHLDAFLRRIVTNEYLRGARRGPRHGPVAGRVAEQIRPESGFAEFESLLSGLSPRERVVVGCRYYLDLSVQAAAEVMGCSTSTVKVLNARALSKLRSGLSGHPRVAAGQPQTCSQTEKDIFDDPAHGTGTPSPAGPLPATHWFDS